MASRLRPTPESGTVAATKQRAQSIGPSWSARGGRQARLALRDAIRSGDRAGAMQIATFAEKNGLPAQASIGSAESRMASSYQQTGSEAAKQAEMGAALDAGQVTEPGADEQPVRTMEKRVGDDRTSASLLRPRAAASPAEPPPVAPGATPPPENPVSGSSVPPVSDVRTRLSQRSSFAPQGLAGRQAFDANLQKSIETGGRDISEGRFANMQKEATRLGVSREQLLSRLQDFGGVSLPGSAVAPRPDTRSLDERLQSYQDEYLGGGSPSELTGKLRKDAEANKTAAAGMTRARERMERRTSPTRAADLSGAAATLVGTAPAIEDAPSSILTPAVRPTPTSGPLASDRTPSVLKRMTERGRERIRGTAFEGSGGYKAAAATEEFLTGTLPNAAENTKRRAKALAQATGRKAAAGSRAVLRQTEGTAFEGTDAYNALKRFLTR